MAKKLYAFLVTGLVLVITMMLLSLLLHWIEGYANGVQLLAGW